MKDKFILDACCGGRMFWFNKHHPNTIYIDNEPRSKGISKYNTGFECKPDIMMDFTKMDFPDKKFKLVVFDPPHLITLGETSEMRKKFGCLNAETWVYDLKQGFNECWRVLDDFGVLIFKWNESEIASNKVLKLFHTQPLFGHRESSDSKTKWFCFMKIPKGKGDYFKTQMELKDVPLANISDEKLLEMGSRLSEGLGRSP